MVESTSGRDLLCPPLAEHGFPLSTTRPPPEPPPPIYEKLEKIDASINAATPSLLALICPSPKPPWWFHGLLLLAPSNQAFGICFISSMCLFFFWFKDALLVFVKMPQKDSVFWNKLVGVPWQSIVTEKAYEADSHRNKLSNQQPTFKHPIKLDNFETNDSRIVRTQVKEIIHNWIGKRTVDSHSYIAKVRVRKRLNERMLVCCSWIGYVLLAFEQAMCIVNYVCLCVSFYLKFVLQQWMGNAPIQLCQSICNACGLIY